MRSFPPLFYHFTQVSFVPAKVIMNFTLTHLKIETRQKRNEVYNHWTVSNHRGEQHLIIPIREFAWLPPHWRILTVAALILTDVMTHYWKAVNANSITMETKEAWKTDRMHPINNCPSLCTTCFLFFVASKIDFWLSTMQAALLLLENEKHSFVRGHTWAFFLESNFTKQQPCMTECRGTEGGVEFYF